MYVPLWPPLFSLSTQLYWHCIPSVALVLLSQVRVLSPPDLCASQQQPCPASYNLSSLLYSAPYGMAVVSGKCFALLFPECTSVPCLWSYLIEPFLYITVDLITPYKWKK